MPLFLDNKARKLMSERALENHSTSCSKPATHFPCMFSCVMTTLYISGQFMDPQVLSIKPSPAKGRKEITRSVKRTRCSDRSSGVVYVRRCLKASPWPAITSTLILLRLAGELNSFSNFDTDLSIP